MTTDLEAQISATLQRVGDRAQVPPSDFTGVVARHRTRTIRRLFTGGLVVTILLVTTGVVLAAERGGSSRSVRLGTTPPSEAPAQESPSRPVLDNCTPTSANESHTKDSPFIQPSLPTEVFADPTRGLSGPLAAVILQPGNGSPPAQDGAGGGLAANVEINGREARIVVYPNSNGLAENGGSTWDLVDGGSGNIYSLGLTVDELRDFTTQIDAGTDALPQRMQSIGMFTAADIATSQCADANGGPPAVITEVRGSLASRYAEMLDHTGDISFHLFDTDHSSIAIWAPGTLDHADRSYHEATPDEWSRLLRAGEEPTTPTTTSAATTTIP